MLSRESEAGYRYARMEGYDMSDTESRGARDFHGDSSSIDKSGEKVQTPVRATFS